MKDIIVKFLESWGMQEGNVHTTAELLDWIRGLNETTYVDINECSINDSSFWFYDDYNGEILNRKRSFFSIKGIRQFEKDELICEQPVIIQPEIGYLGIICKEIDGVLNFLMQAKTEPGNVNCVQISPTIQATKSNFTRAHGGKLPAYIEYFENTSGNRVVFDQIQSEQAARFYKKRNRNILIIIEGDIEVLPNYHWMTLGQIKRLMRIDNLVNMDTRTVLSGIPIATANFGDTEKNWIMEFFSNPYMYSSMMESDPSDNIPRIYSEINNYKQFRDIRKVLIPLNQLVDWKIDEWGGISRKPANFLIRYYDITISGREVQHWTQPLFKAIGTATFGLITSVDSGMAEFLVKPRLEIGSFDKIELGPSIQMEPIHNPYYDDHVEMVFRKKMDRSEGILYDHLLSEEGGRFYHEQNRNVILQVRKEEMEPLPPGYFWMDYRSLNYMVQINNCLNIQLRNLLSLLEI